MEDIRYLLDTNILSDLIKHPAGNAVQSIKSHGEHTLATSIVVACELHFGAAKKHSPILSI
jgi:tRNA(fMet)-specific endonuclease VapC